METKKNPGFSRLSVEPKKKVRKENKGLVDEISATIILQDFLQSRK